MKKFKWRNKDSAAKDYDAKEYESRGKVLVSVLVKNTNFYIFFQISFNLGHLRF